MDISSEDKMNFKIAEKICHYKVRESLEENISQSSGTKAPKKDIDEINIPNLINKSLEEAFKDVSNLGITIEKNDAFDLLLNVEEKLEETQENTCDLQTNDNENLLENLEVANEGSTDIGQNVLANDLVLVQDENLLEDNIDLKDYSDQKINISEGSPYLRVTLPNDKVRVIKKSSFIWLLDEGNGRNDIDIQPSSSQLGKKFKNSKARKQKGNQNNTRNNDDSDTDHSSDGDVIFMESDDSPYFEEEESPSEDIKEIKSIEQIKQGDFVLVSFVGGKRNAQKFNYICMYCAKDH
ncbi:unnamed protein product [Ceutorhynchus assimilis]|uniref:Uncharacterized protein n=1 Tax=Ceutorhynchus assimilis TaxID=467358 RepID=A0A9N9MSZ3_9CUCU|nr:unnamed protein product [Ceutorhynchus assimilis]